MAKPFINIRYIQKDDVAAVVECEALSHGTHIDPDFGVPQLAPNAWNQADLVEAIRQVGSKKTGVCESRALVASVTVEAVDDTGLSSRDAWVCGGLVYEIRPDEIHIRLLTVHPKSHEDVRHKLFSYVVSKARTSSVRKVITVDIGPDDYDAIRFYQNNGFTLERKGLDENKLISGWVGRVIIPEVAKATKKGGEGPS